MQALHYVHNSSYCTRKHPHCIKRHNSRSEEEHGMQQLLSQQLTNSHTPGYRPATNCQGAAHGLAGANIAINHHPVID
jgi:hypothetical protein